MSGLTPVLFTTTRSTSRFRAHPPSASELTVRRSLRRFSLACPVSPLSPSLLLSAFSSTSFPVPFFFPFPPFPFPSFPFPSFPFSSFHCPFCHFPSFPFPSLLFMVHFVSQVLAPADFAFESIGITNETVLIFDTEILTTVSKCCPPPLKKKKEKAMPKQIAAFGLVPTYGTAAPLIRENPTTKLTRTLTPFIATGEPFFRQIYLKLV